MYFRKCIIVLWAMVACIACSRQTTDKEKEMKKLTFTAEQAGYMTAIACFEAKGDLTGLAEAIGQGLDAGLSVSQIKEALSHLYAYTGFPRSLNALGVLQNELEHRRLNPDALTIEGTEPTPPAKDYDALRQGTAVQTMLTGQPFDYAFSPATDYYLKAHLFGDIFARDNLTYADRELVTVSALAGIEGAAPQLRAHVAGARRMGVTDTELLAIANALAAYVGDEEAQRARKAIEEVSGCSTEAHTPALHSAWEKGIPNPYAQFFTGNSYLEQLDGGFANVTFEPGCRNHWHIHHGAIQILVCVKGKGWYQEWGKEAVALTEGTVIAIPEGVKHWHGAAKDSWMQHLAYHKDLRADNTTEWLEAVSDEQYNQIHD